MNPHTVGDAFYNGELENEIRILVTTSGTVNLSDFTFRKDSDREAIMEKIESIHSQTIYHHHDCTPVRLQKRGKLNNKGSSTIVVIQMRKVWGNNNVFLCCRLWYTVGY